MSTPANPTSNPCFPDIRSYAAARSVNARSTATLLLNPFLSRDTPNFWTKNTPSNNSPRSRARDKMAIKRKSEHNRALIASHGKIAEKGRRLLPLAGVKSARIALRPLTPFSLLLACLGLLQSLYFATLAQFLSLIAALATLAPASCLRSVIRRPPAGDRKRKALGICASLAFSVRGARPPTPRLVAFGASAAGGGRLPSLKLVGRAHCAATDPRGFAPRLLSSRPSFPDPPLHKKARPRAPPLPRRLFTRIGSRPLVAAVPHVFARMRKRHEGALSLRFFRNPPSFNPRARSRLLWPPGRRRPAAQSVSSGPLWY